ncbi:hypothetical protein BUALT_Bualt08G0038800 [Buddleja alternifolia]|uniref:Uncharacterized protein n=1 Tax=Buddleja alternifolia TaxID=168488 RepID=A0AAV6X7I3_9LAMI|nr:hypothetical protein BUALT_Bualt08G0038800 [Buddleja alternifolia]
MLTSFQALLVSGSAVENNETMAVGNNRKISAASKHQEKQLEAQRVKHAFDALFSSKRRVPNESDPLHNR